MRTKSLSEQVYDRLLRDLSKGKMKIGDKIKIDQVSKAFEVSHTPVREAINRLVAVGALSYKPNYSAFVPDITLKEYREIIQLRMFLEGTAAANAAENATDSDCDRFEHLQRKIDAYRLEGAYGKLLEVNREFHFQIVEVANIPVYEKVLELLWARTGPTLHLLRGASGFEPNESHPHWRFISAVRVHNSKAARDAMEDDIRTALRSMEKTL